MATWPGVIEAYRDHLPVTDATPVVTLLEGDTPLLEAPRLSERVGARVLLKLEGHEPHRLVQGPGHDPGHLQGPRGGGQGRGVRLDRQHLRLGRRLRRRAGLTCAVLIPEGHIALGKLAQALVHGAKVLQVRGNFDEALDIVRRLGRRAPVTVVNSVNPYRIQGQKTGAFEIVDVLGDAPDVHCIPVGNAGNITAYWRGYCEYYRGRRLEQAPADARIPGRRRRSHRRGPSRSSTPRRSPPPSGSATRRRGTARRRRPVSPAAPSPP